MTTATFLEGMRLYPRVLALPKVATRDTQITLHTIPKKAGEVGVPVPISISKGTHLRIDVPALGLNSKQTRGSVFD